MIDLETFIIMVYVFVDDWYEQNRVVNKPVRGRPAQFSDRAALTLAIISAWREAVPWRSERGFMRYMHRHDGAWFPHLPQVSAFNERKRRLLGVMIRLQQDLLVSLSSPKDLYACVDLLPIPAGSNGQFKRDHSHWLWDSWIGQGQGQLFWGDHLLLSVRAGGGISGWLLGSADIQDRCLLEAFLSTRAGCYQLVGPEVDTHQIYARRIEPPVGSIGAFVAVGQASSRAYLVDKGFNGYRWQQHWEQSYAARVYAVPPHHAQKQRPWTASEKRWLASHRQIVATVFAVLTTVFDIKHLRAHSRWGHYTRIAAKTLGYQLGIWLNRLLDHPDLAHATLIC